METMLSPQAAESEAADAAAQESASGTGNVSGEASGPSGQGAPTMARAAAQAAAREMMQALAHQAAQEAAREIAQAAARQAQEGDSGAGDVSSAGNASGVGESPETPESPDESAEREALTRAHWEAYAAGRMDRLREEEARVRQAYPGFDLRSELTSAQTGRTLAGLLQNGVDLRTAYEVLHKDELFATLLKTAEEAGRNQTIERVRARSQRPQENGAGGSSGTQLGTDNPATWSREHRREINRRVLKGERITL